jgi:hypothetical protein
MEMKPPSAAPAPALTSIVGVAPPTHLKPLSFVATLLLFAIPAAVFSVSLLVVLPVLVRHGMSYFVIFNLCFGTPLGLMLASAFIGYRLERRPFTWPAIRDRFRLGKLSLSGWLWTVGLIAFLFISVAGVEYLTSVARLRGLHIFTWPAEFARFEAALEHTGRDFLGIPLPGALLGPVVVHGLPNNIQCFRRRIVVAGVYSAPAGTIARRMDMGYSRRFVGVIPFFLLSKRVGHCPLFAHYLFNCFRLPAREKHLAGCDSTYRL